MLWRLKAGAFGTNSHILISDFMPVFCFFPLEMLTRVGVTLPLGAGSGHSGAQGTRPACPPACQGCCPVAPPTARQARLHRPGAEPRRP